MKPAALSLLILLCATGAFAVPLDYLPGDLRVETLFADVRRANRDADRPETMELLKRILKELLAEEADSTMRAGRFLRDAGRRVAELFRRVRRGENVSTRQIEALAVETLETLALHYQERASLQRQRKMFQRESEDLQRSRAAGLAALRWSGQRAGERGDQKTVRAFTDVGRESVEGLGKTFGGISRGLNRFFGIERYQTREQRRPQPDPDPWE